MPVYASCNLDGSIIITLVYSTIRFVQLFPEKKAAFSLSRKPLTFA